LPFCTCPIVQMCRKINTDRAIPVMRISKKEKRFILLLRLISFKYRYLLSI
jgi:hypothetical protein